MKPEYWKQRYHKNPNEQRNKAYKYLYGITLKQYEVIHNRQQGKCGICGDKSKTYLCVDHNHSTGQIRGLLCRTCNMNLGWLEKHKTKIDKYMPG